ncbi:MAG TPA: type II toxin-antitoxin system prevent-host-death family antitoxin [Solirubrobacterales bacterium]|nr:type II toxin-antitoxin system prevent-host-death family antitoxin [Solirubrobacterales bacterium]
MGSSPTSSTQAETVGAHEFRNRFGWYMQRAAAGETFNVTRRGKPYVRLTGPQDTLRPGDRLEPVHWTRHRGRVDPHKFRAVLARARRPA